MFTATDFARSTENAWRWTQTHRRTTIVGLLCLLLAVRLLGGHESNNDSNPERDADIHNVLRVLEMRDTINKARKASGMASLGWSSELEAWAQRILKAGALKNDLLVFTVAVPDDDDASATALSLIFDERFVQVNKEPAVENMGVATQVSTDGRRWFCMVFGK